MHGVERVAVGLTVGLVVPAVAIQVTRDAGPVESFACGMFAGIGGNGVAVGDG